jgi:hypothetical protein
MQLRTEYTLASQLAVSSSVDAANLAFEIAGASAATAGDPIQRCWRDVNVASQRQASRTSSAEYGRIREGMKRNGICAAFRWRAVVLGASIGGLMAARVLADFYCTLLLVERD